PQMLIALPFERTDTAPGDDHRLACIGCDRRKVDFSQIYRRMSRARGLLLSLHLNTDMEFKSIIPDECDRTACSREVHRQHQRSTPTPHWKYDTPSLSGYR